MGLALAIALNYDDLIVERVRDALEAGARVEEITESIGVAVLMGGSTSLRYGALALEALVLLEEERSGYAMRSGA
jgi:alkylhydroperoxidase/carboxymuconolactone decarboxylase family protein YurZ